MQHSGWTGFRDILITAAEKVIGCGKQPVVALPYSEESLREIRRKRRLLDEKFSGLDSLWGRRSDFNAYRWRATAEWANKKVPNLKKAEESHDLGAIHRILRETGLSMENKF